MSIAINLRRPAAPARRLASAGSTRNSTLSRAEQLRVGRALLRHLVLAFLAAGTAVYGVLAAGITL